MSVHTILPCTLIALFSSTALGAPAEHPINTPPEIESVGVIPIAHRQLGCVTIARDAENDPIAFHYQWHIDGQPVAGATNDIFDHRAQRGQSIQCEVVPDDGQVEGRSQLSAAVQADNQPPAVEQILLMQTPDGMRCHAEAQDPDGDRVQIRYGWLVNEELVSLDGAMLPVTVLEGDTVQCFAVAHDPWADSAHEGSPAYVMQKTLRAPSPAVLAMADR